MLNDSTATAFYFVGATVLGMGFAARAIGFLHNRSMAQARCVLSASLVYLPTLLVLMLGDGALKLWATR
jgi:heme O synthase-like polyprenyltransferase